MDTYDSQDIIKDTNFKNNDGILLTLPIKSTRKKSCPVLRKIVSYFIKFQFPPKDGVL